MHRTLSAAILITALLALVAPPPGYAVTVSDMEAELICDCGCGKVLQNCTCERADEMRGVIGKLLGQGSGKEEILAAFSAQLGDTILAAPPRKGFNLVAYGLPMTGFAFGSVIAVTLARRWRRQREDEDEDPDALDDLDEETEAMIRREMEELED